MRIVGGELRGRRLVAPRDERTRPMLEKTRAAVFNVLGPRVAGARVLDLCAGTGSLGLEALSRGAVEALLVEMDAVSFRCLERNVEALGVADRATVSRGAWERVGPALPASSRDLAFLDPPYADLEDRRRRERSLAAAREILVRVLAPGGALVIHYPADALEERALAPLGSVRVRRYGRNGVAIAERPPT